jgi:hypothetical protein
MKEAVDIKSCYKISKDVIAKKIEEKYLIVPLVSGVGDLDAEIYSLNRTGAMVWDELDGKKTLEEIILKFSEKFNISKKNIRKDVSDIVSEFVNKGFVEKQTRNKNPAT